MAQKIVQSQTDFTGGEIDPQAKRRDDHPLARLGCRVLSNWRPRTTGTADVRPGRRALAITLNTRSERFRMSPTQELVIEFGVSAGQGVVTLTDLAGDVIATNTSGSYLWTGATVSKISWTVCPDRIVICYPGMQPQLIMWAQSTNTFTFQAFAFLTAINQIQEPFYRFTNQGATMSWNAALTNGGNIGNSITLTCSVPFFINSMIGSRLSICGGQVLITAVGSTTPITAATVEILSQMPLGIAVGAPGGSGSIPFWLFPPGILAQTQTDLYEMEVTTATSAAIAGVCLNAGAAFGGGTLTQDINSDLGSTTCGPTALANVTVQTVQWQQEFMSAQSGWPSACFFDRDRLGFCAFPQFPEAVLWGAVGGYDQFWVDSTATTRQPAAGAEPTSAILEFIAGKPSVQNVTGWNGDEFVFTDKGIYEIPINAASQSDLAPGNVQFIQLSDDSANFVRPVITKNAVIFVNAGGTRIAAILRATAFVQGSYVAQDMTELYEHLITEPIMITVSQGDGQYPERYIYVLNANGTLAIGRITGDQPIGSKQYIGWQPWTGEGTVLWVSASLGTVYYLTQYGAVNVIEIEDITVFMDQAVFVNNAPANMLPSGKGPFTAFAGGTVRLMSGEIDYGDRSIDANGNMIFSPDDDQSVSTLIAGQPFTSTMQPIVQEAGGAKDPDQRQRQRRRRVSRGIATVFGSSGFNWGDREIPPYDFGQDATQQPTLRETAYTCRPIGRNYDPPPPKLIKDAPGPLEVLEMTLEVTV